MGLDDMRGSVECTKATTSTAKNKALAASPGMMAGTAVQCAVFLLEHVLVAVPLCIHLEHLLNHVYPVMMF